MINKDVAELSLIKPVSSELPVKKEDNNFSRKIRQIGEISYQPNYESEEVRHLKVSNFKYLYI